MTDLKTAPRYTVGAGWNALLPRRVPNEQLPKERRYHAIVVGGGYTGLAAARRLAELMPEKDIIVIEASEIGEGSSARNSGFLSPSAIEPRPNAYGSAEDDANRKTRIVLAGLDWLRAVVEEHKINCDWDETAPRIVAAATRQGERWLLSSRQALERRNLRYLEHDAQGLRALLGTDYYQYGYETLTRAFVQPAALIRGLADTLSSNVTVLEHRAVEAVEGSGPFKVRTPRAEFVADKVFIANNAHARALGLLADRMIVVYTYAGLTPELEDDELGRMGSLPAWGVLPPTRMGTTMRKVGRRFLIRSSWSYEKEVNPQKVRSTLTRLFRRRFPQMRSYHLEHVWGGMTAITVNGGMYFGELRPGLYASVGCQGAGVLRGNIHGKLLAEMACGSQSPLLTDRLMLTGPDWIPPEPFRGIGAIARMTWEHWRAGREY
ncbi:NAD(P)/FAD-dependent oxidoreductase [Bradyrhizobium arachidis]|uniref:FAD-binding oxidoreductase n=1 Tax=Bradyrhizobium arachidis TaxID=858423 RepID=A0AAE7NKJ4_9BRAD|nr:FAD-binding oxidoreductase [Bradyrhizobium arachidis]QOZ66662.1 FAD-binding oxidoreductase [Bradyrhizobium arachidis]